MDLDLSTIDIQRQLEMLDRAECEESLYMFLTQAWKYIDASPWRDGWPIEAVAEHLQAVCDGDIKRLIINIPPRHGKSTITSVAFPAWVWAQQHRSPTSGPGVQFLMASYANQLVLRDSVKCRRLIESPWYQKLWGERFSLNSDQNTKSRFSNDQGGERLITSVGAAVTGEGGSCFPAWSKVSTPAGYQPISSIKAGDNVFAFDHSLGKVVEKSVIATQVRRSDTLYEVHTVSGNSFECTGDHPVFVEGAGYIRASELGVGDRVFVERRAEGGSASSVRQLRRSGEQDAIRGSQSSSAGEPGRLLLEKVLFYASCGEKHKALRYLREAATASAFRGLLGRMSGTKALGQAKETCLSALSEGIRGLDNVLRFAMRGCGAFPSHEGCSEFKLQPYGAVFEPVQSNAADSFGARRVSLSGMRGVGAEEQVRKDVSSRPSYRRGQSEQCAGELDYSVRELPSVAPSWAVDVIERIEVYRGSEIDVYDIQVEGCSNFFAEGVLVHNCIIVDDPNSASEAFSEATIEATKEWWDGTMSTRLNDMKTGAYIIIQQRLAEDDLTGHVLEKESDGWTHLCLPMRYEADRAFVTNIGWEDPRSVEGELLWPDRFGEDEVLKLEKSLGPFMAAGQLQQRPEPAGGGIIKREWWQLWEDASYPPMDYIVASLDTAYTVKTNNDYSALTVWGVFTTDATAVANRVIDADGKAQYTDRTYNQFAPKLMMMHAWQERLEFHDLVEKVAKTCKALKVDKLLVENKAAGISVSQELRRLYGYEGFAVQLSDPKSMDKLARLYSVQHLFADGMVYAPDKVWAEQVITQVGQFPKGKHDDLVDTVSMSIRHLRDIGLLTRAMERRQELENLITYPGKKDAPLYPA